MSGDVRLGGRRAIVTGASRGMGRAIASGFARAGATVLAVARNRSLLEQTYGSDPNVLCAPFDLTDLSAPDAIAEQAREQMGGVDIVVNAAGLYENGSLDQGRDEVWARAFATNVDAPLALCVATLPELKRSGHGRIINLGSVSTRLTQSGMGAYNSSKHALTGLTMSMAVEWGGHGITANVLHPGFILTDMSRAIADDVELAARVGTKIAVGRMGHVEEIAHAALMLADVAADYITGQSICIDGGYSTGVYDLFPGQ